MSYHLPQMRQKQGGIASISKDTTGTNGVYQSRQSQMELVGKDHEMNSTIKKNEKSTNGKSVLVSIKLMAKWSGFSQELTCIE